MHACAHARISACVRARVFVSVCRVTVLLSKVRGVVMSVRARVCARATRAHASVHNLGVEIVHVHNAPWLLRDLCGGGDGCGGGACACFGACVV